VARDCAVLNADDVRCLQMADHTRASRIAYVTMNPRHELVRQHIGQGGLACVLEEQIRGHMITLYDKGTHLPLVWTHLIPATLEGAALHNVQNAMFAAVMAHAQGVKVENIRQGLRTVDTTFFQAPGRHNVYDKLPFKVILVYGHNPAAVQAMADMVGRLDVAGRRIGIISAPGDRRDEDIREVARIAGAAFDHLILRRDEERRGRRRSEVPRLQEETLLASGFAREHLQVIVDEQEAVAAGLELARPGDLLVIFGDNITRTWKQIIYFKGEDGLGHAPRGDDSPTPVVVPLPPPRATPIPDAGPAGASVIADERGVRLAKQTDD
jgi:cyanophycin synthetase